MAGFFLGFFGAEVPLPPALAPFASTAFLGVFLGVSFFTVFVLGDYNVGDANSDRVESRRGEGNEWGRGGRGGPSAYSQLGLAICGRDPGTDGARLVRGCFGLNVGLPELCGKAERLLFL